MRTGPVVFNAEPEILSLSCKPPDPALPGIDEIAFDPFDLRGAFKREDVGAAAVGKEMVVRHDDRIASEFLYSALKGAKRLEFKIVGESVKEQQLPPGFSRFAKCTWFRSPCESMPTCFCCSPLLKVNTERYPLEFTPALPS